jgi:hypothetical protein
MLSPLRSDTVLIVLARTNTSRSVVMSGTAACFVLGMGMSFSISGTTIMSSASSSSEAGESIGGFMFTHVFAVTPFFICS